ncbi:MAG: RnfABCDGE type electron transport complex subunit D [Treponema sp.]|jgi:electron transport complex protein RnfD|nr:RnfABCDGE type electron transport complex subunit D [Treponema sp.]
MPDKESRLWLNPQVNISRSTAARMWLVFFCAFVAVLQSAISDAGASLFVALAALAGAVLTELAITGREHRFAKIKDGSASASALVLALLLPNQIHPVYAVLGAAFAMAVVKHSFGGLGSNWMNPALGGWLFVRFSWPSAFERALESSGDYFSGAGSAVDQAVSSFLNKTIFPFFSAALPAGYIDRFASQEPGIIADRAVLALVVGTAFIAAFQISRSWLSVLYLAVFGLLARMLGDLPSSGFWWNGDVILAFLSGGTLVTAFILIADPSSGAKSVLGNATLAVFAAILGFAFRYFGGAFYGCFFAVALVNAVVPLLCKMERRLLYSTAEINASRGVSASRGGGND